MTPADIQALKTIVSEAVQAEVAPLKAAVVSLQSDVSSLRAEVSALDRNVTGVQTGLAAGNRELALFQTEVRQKLDDIYDGIQEVMGDLDAQADTKVFKVRHDLEPRVDQLEQLHRPGQHPSI